MSIVIAYTRDSAPGWAPVNHMVNLASAMFDAPVVCLSPEGGFRKALCAVKVLMCSRSRKFEKPDLLLIVHSPAQLKVIASVSGWRDSYNRCVAWVVDSFWMERLPRMRFSSIFQRIYIMYGNDREEYASRTKVEVDFLGWGADALGIRSVGSARDIDLLRVGRQPPAWNRDEDNLVSLKKANITFQGRPPFHEDPSQQYLNLMACYRRSKFVLAFSNRVAAAKYTHPSKEYITARWTDGLAAGCVIAGVPPLSDRLMRECFWSEATLDLATIDRDSSIPVLVRAIESWSPEIAEKNHLMALRNLDWRWRFQKIGRYLGGSFPRLDRDLKKLHDLCNV